MERRGLVLVCAAAIGLGGAGCHEGDEHDPCTDIDCSDHGVCLDEGGRAYCLCDPGFHASGLECVADGVDGDVDGDADGDSDVDGDADTDTDADADTDTGVDGDVDAEVDADSDADADAAYGDLSVVVDGTGGGSVVSSPYGIDCGSTCVASFEAGTTITLTATADAGSDFVGWTGAGCSTGPTCVFVHDGSDLEVTATFDLTEHDLDVTLGGDGTGEVVSSPAGIDCGVDCAETFVHGTSVTLTATETGGSSFGGWGGDCSGLSETCVLTMDGDSSVTASFDLHSFTLSVSLAGTGGGTISSDDAAIDCPGACSASYAWGSDVELFAAEDATSDFVGWSGACAGTGACVVAVTSATSVTATFVRRRHVLTVTKAGTGDGLVTSTPGGIACGTDCAEEYDEGATVSLAQSPSGGAIFIGWSGACTGTGGCTVPMAGPRTVTAEYCQPRICGAHECGTVSNGCGGTMSCGRCCDVATHQCVQAPPVGWSGPVVRQDLTGGVLPSSCAASYPTRVDDYDFDLVVTGSCTCRCAAATGVTCNSPSVQEHSTGGFAGCDDMGFASQVVDLHVCEAMEPAMRDGGPYYQFEDPGTTGGSCAASYDPLPVPHFDGNTRICGGAILSTDVCTEVAAVCAPNASAPFDDRLCIWRSGDVVCPAGDYTVRLPRFTGFTDGRTCSCACGSPTTGACGWHMAYMSGTCSAPTLIAEAGPGACTSAGAATLMEFGISTDTPPTGTCSPAGGGMTGSAYPTGPVTVCCQP